MDWSCLVPSLVPDTRHYPGRGTKGRLNNPSSMAHLEGNSESASQRTSDRPLREMPLRLPRATPEPTQRERPAPQTSLAPAQCARSRQEARQAPSGAREQRRRSFSRQSPKSSEHGRMRAAPEDKAKAPLPKQRGLHTGISRKSSVSDYLMILVTRPEPTVRPPSRMAKPRPSSMAMGWISSTLISVLSPGMTISVPSGSVITPVTSVVRK